MYHQQEYIQYRIDRSKEIFEDALILAEKERWRSCVNRLYYSCFQLLDALLYAEGMSFKTHNGLKNSFFLNFIKSGLIEKDYGKLYNKLFDWRNEGDYSIFVDFEDKDVKSLLPKVELFLDKISILIEERT